jgi:hypothetical protein
MRLRTATLALLALALLPAVAVAQPGVLVGGGVTSPLGDLGDVASNGYHARLGVQMGIPTLPVAIRLDGDYHRLSEADASYEPTSVLGGALGVVFTLPGVGLSPYVLTGVGRYRVESGPVGSSEQVQRNGFQAGFGISLGAIGFGALVEIRWVRVDADPGSMSFVPVSVALRM